MNGQETRTRLRRVRWIGGGSGAGKSTVAARLAVTHGVRIYHTEALSHEDGSIEVAHEGARDVQGLNLGGR